MNEGDGVISCKKIVQISFGVLWSISHFAMED